MAVLHRFLAVLLCVQRGLAFLDGVATDRALIADATNPPAVRAFNLRTFEMDTVVEYNLDNLIPLGVSMRAADGTNRTLRPAGLALLEGSLADAIYRRFERSFTV